MIAANERRLERLARHNLVEKMPEGTWRVPPNLVDTLHSREQTHPRLRSYRELLDTSGSRLKSMDGQIARQRQQIEAVMAALVTVPGSKALGARLAAEEAKLAQFEAERAALTDQRPRSCPTLP